MVQKASEKREKFQEVKSEIDQQLSTIHERLGNVCNFIRENLKTEAHPENVLVQSQQSYLDCLTIRHVELEQLLRKDEAHWVS